MPKYKKKYLPLQVNSFHIRFFPILTNSNLPELNFAIEKKIKQYK